MLSAEGKKETKYRHVPALVELVIWIGRQTLTKKPNYMLNNEMLNK